MDSAKLKALGYVTLSEAARIAGLSQNGLRKRIDNRGYQHLLKRVGGRIYIDPKSDEFKLLADRELNSTNDGGTNKTVKNILKTEFENMEMEDIKFKSAKAQLEIPIHKAMLNRYKIEKEKLQIEKDSKTVIEFGTAEYLYLGYLDRVNMELLNISKRISKKIELEIQGGIHGELEPSKIASKILKLITREHEAILRDVVKEQKNDLQSWQEENE